jgi:hypothetical protein
LEEIKVPHEKYSSVEAYRLPTPCGLRGGKGIRKIARECGVGTGAVQRIRQEMEGPFVGMAA